MSRHAGERRRAEMAERPPPDARRSPATSTGRAEPTRAAGSPLRSTAAGPIAGSPDGLRRLQRVTGNAAVRRLIARGDVALQRFSVPADYSFTAQGRAALPPSLAAAPLETGNERHHIISDRSLLALLEAEKEKGAAEVGDEAEVVPVDANSWAKAALDAEVGRIGELEEMATEEALEAMSDTKARKIRQALQSKGEYVDLAARFDGGDRSAPQLDAQMVSDTLLSVLEWMPSNLVIGREGRALDPGDWVDLEALSRHPDQETRRLIAKIGILTGDIDSGTLARLDGELVGTRNETKWKQLVEDAQAARAPDLLAELITKTAGGSSSLKKSTAKGGKKQKLTADAWHGLLLKLIDPTL
ncbi:MAG: hypothetical protein WEB13_09775 [Dehalococcoidia bacterium]